jgi:acetyl-CoA acetyltransferase
MTMDDYLSARMISTPFGLYDCDVPCDAAIAVIVSAVDAARHLRKPPVRIEAIGTQWTERPLSHQSSLSHLPQTLGPAAHLWSRTALKPADIDMGQIYDGFSFNTLSWIEALGFCGIGEAKDFFANGTNIARDGMLPLNTNGGQLSEGRTHGLGYVYEAVAQLRGEADLRQVPGTEVVVVAAGGLTPAAAMILITDR